jgi:competence protein ComEC
MAHLSAAFISGLLCGSFLPYFPITIIVLLACAACVLTVLEHRQRLTPRDGLLLFGTVLGGILYWTAFLWMVTENPPPNLLGKGAIKIVGTVVEPVRHAPDRAVMVLECLPMEEDGRTVVTGRIRLTWRGPDAQVRQGDRVTFVARVRPPVGLINPGGFDHGAFLKRHGIDGIASVSGPGQVIVLQSDVGLFHGSLQKIFDTWRDHIREASISVLQGFALGVYLSMIIGEPDYLAPEVRDWFMATGTVHILSISGSHLGLIAFLSFFLIARICRHLPALWVLALSRHLTPTRLAALSRCCPSRFTRCWQGRR